jgi:hypothetical protein
VDGAALFKNMLEMVYNPPPMDDLTERYNEGIVPAPPVAPDRARLRRPNWIPTPARVQAARQTLLRYLLVLTLVFVAVSVLSTLLGGF